MREGSGSPFAQPFAQTVFYVMSPSSQPLVLITGAAGFLGRHAAARFARAGWRVVGIGHGVLDKGDLARLGMSVWRQGPVITGPIGELIAEHGAPDAVVHAAGSSSVRIAAEDPAQDFQRTVGGTIELLEALRRWAPESCLLLSSSAAVYGSNHHDPIPEHAAPAPISTYGLHKLRAEELCLEAAERHRLQVAAVRFFSLYGAGLRKQIFWDLWNKIIADDRVVLGGTGCETRDFLHVEDAVRLLLHLAETRGIERPSVVNGGTGKATTIRDAAALLVRSSDCRAEIVFEGLSRPGDPAHLVADVGRLRATGYRSRIELADGLADYAAWAADGASTERASRRAPIATRLGAA